MPHQSITPDTFDIDSGYYCGRCGGYFKTTSLSSSRPPVYIAENCSCVEASGSGHDFGGGTQLVQNKQSWGPYGTTAILCQHDRRTKSYASSNASRGQRGPEGPEKEAPDINGFLVLTPAAGLGEERHRRSSFRSEMMRRYMQEPEEACEVELQQDQKRHHQSQVYTANHKYSGRALGERNTFLNQDVYMPPLSGRGSGKTKSWDSEGSGGSGESALEHWETTPVDHIMGFGAWAVPVSGEDFGYGGIAASCYEYPMNMSGMTEALYDTERR